ncbi:MAG: tetratricopeptide repeat protein [Candidatus Thorarchaeota archaeon]
MVEKRRWPQMIQDALPKDRASGQTIGNELVGGPSRDVTAVSLELLRAYAPDLILLGRQLLAEKKEKEDEKKDRKDNKKDKKEGFAGVQYRAVKKEDDKARCLQYVYVYTQQLGAVSLLWMCFVPLLMAIWGWWVRFAFPAEIALAREAVESGNFLWLIPLSDAAIPFWLIGGVWLPILLAGVFPHIIDYMNMPRGRWFYVRSTTPLIAFGVIQLFAFINAIIPFLLGSLAVVLFIVWGFEQRKMSPSAHAMDYAPVFVWIREYEKEELREAHQKGKKIPDDKKDPNHWRFDSACWDYYHYFGVKKKEKDMKKNYHIYTANYLQEGKRVRLLMDNPWHSFARGSQVQWFYKASIGALPILLASSIWIWASGLYDNYYPLSVWLIALFAALIVLCTRNIARYPSELVDNWSDYLPNQDANLEESDVYREYHLTDEKLRELWNLTEKEARLVIISKMQNPHHSRSDFFENFRDEADYLLYDYRVVDRLSKLERELAMANVRHSRTLRELGRTDESEQLLKQVVEFKPDLIEGWTNLGDLYADTGRRDQVADLIKQAGEQKPDIKGDISFGLGRTLESAKYEEDFLEEAESAYVQAAKVESEKEDPEASLRRLLDDDPDNPYLLEKLAELLTSRGRTKEADEAREKAKEARKTRMK